MSYEKLEIGSYWGIDKVTVRVHMDYVNTEFKEHYTEEDEDDGINVINENQYYYINFHERLFQDWDFSVFNIIYNSIQSLYTDKHFPLLKVEPTREFLLNHCKLSELEICFDFLNFYPIIPLLGLNWNRFKKTDTYYSGDYRKYYRSNGDLKDRQHSLICMYDRGLKINGIPGNLWRFEYRLTRKYIKRLTLADLLGKWSYVYDNKVFPLLVKYTDKVMNPYQQKFVFDCLYVARSPFISIFMKSKKFGRNFQSQFVSRDWNKSELYEKYNVNR